MLIDVNVLLYAALANAPEHPRAAAWLEAQLNGERRVGIAWESILGFLRLATNPRVASPPLDPAEAWRIVASWLDQPVVWNPGPTEAHGQVLGDLIGRYRLTGKLVPDAQLVAIAIQHGLEICSADSDFARFTEVRWRNPLAAD
jgi:toxin-antitoxin system PIN domain toxin